jgi:ABC-type transporter Mla MlaB component
MFRVSKAEEPSRMIVTIDGQLSGDSVAVVETCCDQAISTGKAVHLFLRDVSTVDQAGRVLLCRVAARGVRLLGSGVYTSYLVKALNPGDMGPLNPGASLR